MHTKTQNAEVNPSERQFTLDAGVVIGRVDNDVIRALGIPYAKAARFAPPTQITQYEGLIKAFERAPAAPQLPPKLFDKLIGGDDLPMDEDCQRLSVTAPADLRDDEKLPVMVWIHGGGNVATAGDSIQYDPRALVTEQRVIVVAVTYRLGMLGFLGDGTDVPANLGLLDSLTALRWIQDNIAAFGGDSNLVTIFGQSSGADVVAHLMISDGAGGLFQRVIIQSAPLSIYTGRRPAMTKAMLAAVGKLPRDAPVEDILALQPVAEKAAKGFGMATRMPFAMQYGFSPLPAESARDEAWQKAAKHIDVLIGCTAEETGILVALAPALGKVFQWPVIGKLARGLILTPSTRSMYGAPAQQFVARHREAGGHAYQYRMTWRPDNHGYGAAHLTDLALLFGTRQGWEGAALLGSTDWDDIAHRGRVVRSAWAEFARTGAVADMPVNDTITFLRD
jgi:para-nitrobenzyl esterase